ncbi:MAG: ABC transporter ATPase [Oscillospiraceae bacterium]|nr:ABC transporter ATPase [Oscillospiraceae bacterium]
MRKLDTIQKEHLLNHAYATDTPDKSGACHFYTVMDSEDKLIMGYIRFQQGVREGNLPVGLRDDDLLEIVRDRLKGFQKGPFPCEENAKALACIEEALGYLKTRTDSRFDRGVLGKETK